MIILDILFPSITLCHQLLKKSLTIKICYVRTRITFIY